MATTAPQSNNVKLTFRRKAERERMPSTSQVQARAMAAAASGKSKIGIPKSVGEEFTEAQAPGSVKKLPERKNNRVDKLRAAGRISDKQAAKFGKV